MGDPRESSRGSLAPLVFSRMAPTGGGGWARVGKDGRGKDKDGGSMGKDKDRGKDRDEGRTKMEGGTGMEAAKEGLKGRVWTEGRTTDTDGRIGQNMKNGRMERDRGKGTKGRTGTDAKDLLIHEKVTWRTPSQSLMHLILS